MTVNVRAATHPLKLERVDAVVPDGLTVAEIFARVQPDPVLRAHAKVYLGPHELVPERWDAVKPKAGTTLTIRAFPAPRGGGGGGKSPGRILLQVAVIAAGYFGGPLLGAALSPTGLATAELGFGGLTYGTLGRALIGAAGLLLTSAIAPIRPPKMAQLSGQNYTSSSPTLFIEGARNKARPFEVVPVQLGRTRAKPDLGARPYTEVVGDDNYLRMLFVWGVGPITLSDFKIGDTDLDEFTDVQVEHREGYDSDDPITLYPSVVDEDQLTINLTDALGWQTRTTSANADEISVDLTFPRGLFTINNNGGRTSRSVTLQIEYSVADADDWQSIPTADGVRTFPDDWTNEAAGEFNQVTFTEAQDSAVRYGITWTVPTRGQYDVRVRRTTADTSSTQIIDEVTWTALRRITVENPIDSPVPLAMTAIRIKATDQLNSIIDEFNGLCEMVGTYWNATSPTGWVIGESRNPAACFRRVLQGNGLQEPLADARLDLTTLAEWAEFCDTRGYEFNMRRDFQASLWDTLLDVCAAGRATPTQIDGKWSVVIDQEQAVPVSHVTPRNSWGFSSAKAFLDLPHAFRVRFSNEDEDYRQDERRVYLDGYTEATATKFETLELPGVTNADQVYRLARYHAAVATQRPERYEFNQELESMAYQRGDLILLTHDVLLVGTASGRINSVTTDSAGDVTELELDTGVEMTAGTDYGISIRTVGNVALTRQVVTDAGEQTTVVLSTVIPAADAPVAGDLFGFGLLGSETEEALVAAIQPEVDFTARVACVPYRDVVYDTESETIPAFATNLTPLVAVPAPIVINVRSDESALAVGVGDTVTPRINVKVQPISDTEEFSGLRRTLVVQGRLSSTGSVYRDLTLERPTEAEVFVLGVQTGETWDLRLRWGVEGRLPGPYSYINGHTVVGKSTPPAALSGLTLSAFGGQAFLRWDVPIALDVWFGGTVKFRHSQSMSGATWAESTSIGTIARARDPLATLPLKPGTYLARVFDQDGNPSDVVSVTTKQASVLTYASADTLDEAPGFTGNKTDVAASGGVLKLDGAGLVDAIPDVDGVISWDSYGGVTTNGTYEFAYGFDFATVGRYRLTTRLTTRSIAVNDTIDDRTANIDDWEDFDGTTQAEADCVVYVRHTDDDPAASGATWSSWEQLDSAEFEARGFEFKAELSTTDSAYNTEVTELGVDAEEVA